MNRQHSSVPSAGKHIWEDWFSAHAWWTALLAGGILCVAALVLS
jgi:hypothetical protein